MGNPNKKGPKKVRRKDAIQKIKILKVEKVADEPEPIHRVNLELEVKGIEPPAIVSTEAAVEIVPNDHEPQLAASTGWVAWLKSLW